MEVAWKFASRDAGLDLKAGGAEGPAVDERRDTDELTPSAIRSAVRLPPHVEALLVKPQRTTLNVDFILKLIRDDRLFAQIAKLAGALASKVLLRRFGWERQNTRANLPCNERRQIHSHSDSHKPMSA
jgi:hypothetical protein